MSTRAYRNRMACHCALIAVTAILATPCWAQAQPDTDRQNAEIIVTGSRVITTGNSSPTPVTVASAAQLLGTQPFSIVQGLQLLPGMLGSNTSTSLASGGMSNANLRGVGPQRTLLLLDNQRVGPADGRGASTPEIVPQMLLQRVEVVTGGASAVYGSDAVSGVVHFITDNKFNGLKMDVSSGISQYGDDAKYNVGVAFGHKLFDGRGHIEGSYEYRSSAGLTRESRDFLYPNYTEQGNGTAANPYTLTRGATLSTVSFGGLINSGPLAGLNFAQNGTLSAFNHGTATGTQGVEVGGDGATYTGVSLDAQQKAHHEFLRFDYDVANNLHFYVAGIGTQAHFNTNVQNILLNQVSIGYNNAYLSAIQPAYQAVVQAQLAANSLSSFQFSKMLTSYPNQDAKTDENYWSVRTGLSGDLRQFKWDFGYNHSRSDQSITNDNSIDYGRLAAALNAVVSPTTGKAVCNASLVNPTAYGNCVSLNVFGSASENQAALNYIRAVTRYDTIYTQDNVNASLRGAPFSLPAGPVNMALSAEYRRVGLKITTPTAAGATVTACNGVQFNCTVGMQEYYGALSAPLDPVSQQVYEFSYEANVPILKNAPFAKEFNLNGAARYTHYNTSGGVFTWKGGIDWKVNDDIRLRATQSRDIRAPNLTEMYQANTVVQIPFWTDPQTGTSNPVELIVHGNSALKPEKADTTTAGIVFTPSAFPGFSLAFDWYRINIKDAIISLNGLDRSTAQACQSSGGTAEVCSLYTRSSSGSFPSLIYSEPLNVAKVRTNGFDIDANFRRNISGHNLGLRLLVTYQPHLIYDNGPSGVVDAAGAADGISGLNPVPKIKIIGNLDYQVTDGIRFTAQERWRGPLKQNGDSTLVYADGNIPSIAYTDITATFDVAKKFIWYVNIQNLLNQKPRAFASAGASQNINYLGGFADGDDVVGRYFTVGARMKF